MPRVVIDRNIDLRRHVPKNLGDTLEIKAEFEALCQQ